jgi:isocitrate dehydrogenase (NAD+)
MILAVAALLNYVGIPQAEKTSRAIYEAVFEAVHSGQATTDLGGSLTTSQMTDEVIRRVQAKLEVWADLSQ